MNAVLKVLPDPVVQKTLLDLLLQGVESGQHSELIAAGLDPAVLDGLRHLRTYELARLSQRDLGFSLLINSSVLGHQIGILHQQISNQALQEEFAIKGCPTPLFLRLFRMQKRDVKSLRFSLGIRSTNELLQTVSPSERARIEDAWVALRPANGGWAWGHSLSQELVKVELKSWQQLTELFPDFTLFTLYNVVAAFERLGTATVARQA